MDALDLTWHLLNFIAPALGMAVLMATLAKWIWRAPLRATSWWQLARRCGAAGVGVLVLSLVITGQDGRMVTYAGLVLACALVPWWASARS